MQIILLTTSPVVSCNNVVVIFGNFSAKIFAGMLSTEKWSSVENIYR